MVAGRRESLRQLAARLSEFVRGTCEGPIPFDFWCHLPEILRRHGHGHRVSRTSSRKGNLNPQVRDLSAVWRETSDRAHGRRFVSLPYRFPGHRTLVLSQSRLPRRLAGTSTSATLSRAAAPPTRRLSDLLPGRSLSVSDAFATWIRRRVSCDTIPHPTNAISSAGVVAAALQRSPT